MTIPACLPQRLLNNWWICWFMERYREQERERPRGRLMSFPPHFHTFPPYVTMFLMFLPIFSYKYSMIFPYVQWEIKKDPYIWRYVNVPYFWPYFLGKFPYIFWGYYHTVPELLGWFPLNFSHFWPYFHIFSHFWPYFPIFSGDISHKFSHNFSPFPQFDPIPPGSHDLRHARRAGGPGGPRRCAEARSEEIQRISWWYLTTRNGGLTWFNHQKWWF